MALRSKFINTITLAIFLAWSFLIGAASIFMTFENYKYVNMLAKREAVASAKKDLAYLSSHGEVYVPITKDNPPNPYLAHIPNRDINTSDGQCLTLMNSAHTLSRLMKEYSEFYGAKGHITSKILMNERNKADSWETKALNIAESTRKPVFEKGFIDGEEYFRYLNPLETQKSCLKCHAVQGYKVGDIRGGVSISIPMKSYYEEAFSHSLFELQIIALIYLLGLFLIFYGRKKARKILENKVKDYEQHIFSLVNLIEQRDSYTAGHTKRVARYSEIIAISMGYKPEKVDDLYRACMLHDIGKISTPDSILLKPGKLTSLEYNIIKVHVSMSYELLSCVDIYKEIAEIVRHHHERYDGTGYPQGLKGNEIPMIAQIMELADAFDAMTTNRIYKARKSVDTAILELQELSGKQFNPEIVKVAIVVLANIEIEHNITQRPKTGMEKERFSYFYRDSMTGVYNKAYLEYVLAYNRIDEYNLRCLNILYLHNFTQYNKENGWDAGDEMLKKFANELDLISDNDFVFRLHGDDFVLLNKEHLNLEEYIGELEGVLKETVITLTYKHLDISDEAIDNMSQLEKYLT